MEKSFKTPCIENTHQHNLLLKSLTLSVFPKCVRELYLKAELRCRHEGLVFEEMEVVKHNFVREKCYGASSESQGGGLGS